MIISRSTAWMVKFVLILVFWSIQAVYVVRENFACTYLFRTLMLNSCIIRIIFLEAKFQEFLLIVFSNYSQFQSYFMEVCFGELL